MAALMVDLMAALMDALMVASLAALLVHLWEKRSVAMKVWRWAESLVHLSVQLAAGLWAVLTAYPQADETVVGTVEKMVGLSVDDLVAGMADGMVAKMAGEKAGEKADGMADGTDFALAEQLAVAKAGQSAVTMVVE